MDLAQINVRPSISYTPIIPKTCMTVNFVDVNKIKKTLACARVTFEFSLTSLLNDYLIHSQVSIENQNLDKNV